MNEIPPISPASPSGSKKTIWIVAIAVVVCLCFVVGAVVLGGGYFYLSKSGRLPFFPSRATVTPGQASGSGSLVVEAFDPTNSTLPTLQELAAGWTGATAPSTSEWNVAVTPYRQTLVFLGWCAASQSALDVNYQHMEWSLSVDGQSVDVTSLYKLEENTSTNGFCRTYVGLIRQWSGSTHTIITTQRLDASINDGWGDYPAGDYIDIYHVTVAP